MVPDSASFTVVLGDSFLLRFRFDCRHFQTVVHHPAVPIIALNLHRPWELNLDRPWEQGLNFFRLVAFALSRLGSAQIGILVACNATSSDAVSATLNLAIVRAAFFIFGSTIDHIVQQRQLLVQTNLSATSSGQQWLKYLS